MQKIILMLTLLGFGIFYPMVGMGQSKKLGEKKMSQGLPQIELITDQRSYPVFRVNKEKKPMSAVELLKKYPQFLEPAQAKVLALIVNHHLHSSEFPLIVDIPKYQTEMKARYKSENPDQEFNPHRPQLHDYGMPAVGQIVEPSFDGRHLVFYVSSPSLADFPYKAEVEMLGSIIGDDSYTPLDIEPEFNANDSNKIQYPLSSHTPKKIVYSEGPHQSAMAEVEGNTPIPARDLAKAYPGILKTNDPLLLAEWVFNFDKYNKKDEYFVVVIENPESFRRNFNEKWERYQKLSGSEKKSLSKSDLVLGFTDINDYGKLDFSGIHKPSYDGKRLIFWWRDGGDLDSRHNQDSEYSLRQYLNNMIRVKYSEIVIEDGKPKWDKSETINEYLHQRSKSPLTITLSVENNWPSLKVERDGKEQYIVATHGLENYPDILTARYAKEIALIVNHTERKKDFIVIEDPKVFEKEFNARYAKEDLATPFSHARQLHDFDKPNFSLIEEPSLTNGKLKFFAYRRNLNRPPYLVEAMIKNGKIGKTTYTRLDMLAK